MVMKTPADPFRPLIEKAETLGKLNNEQLKLHDITEAVKSYQQDVDNGAHRGVAAQMALNSIEHTLGMSYEHYLAMQQNPDLRPPHNPANGYTEIDAITGAINMYYDQLDRNGAAKSKVHQSVQAGTAMRTIENTLGLDEGREQGGTVRKKVEPRSPITKRDPLIPDGSGRGIGN